MPLAPRHIYWLIAAFLVGIGALLWVITVAARPASPPPPPPSPPPAPPGPPPLTSADAAPTANLAPDLRQTIQPTADPNPLLPVIVVSQGAVQHPALQGAVARRSPGTGLTFTSGQVKAGQVAALAA